ncbi:MAG: 4-hydroxythreonine-4-phosphate dehydrogenase PdxA [Desulfarculus sp.]|nr:4-hydroxythreonine-4-phosphate dehydrogenase PdxA [Pseudomonadota bacterium]MBV1718335.1 4-hydroxythreonine-4-phosphate dehydrogenase PdxA [Desulfarculus sp.]MBU4576892.1 4-hydroxythreonine-4-phosphate dehydrogenase PdxA [Pseudomonadota bacterium]MBU4596306.1 4-hydroxythreonine-4-phosphate dehydrogenase PdxA [Pseudomonadota bacterium]MBV1739603.1 4-hydroxythreonine-4-phosphate dehydrogenase PdxA [Desulfarculus sp.]
MKPRIAVTLGDPAGVGPEIVARLCVHPPTLDMAELVVVGRRELLNAGAKSCGLPAPHVEVVEVGEAAEITPGRPSPESGKLAGAFVEKALELVQAGQAAAMATAPISKEALKAAGYPDTGHTTLLARRTGTERPVMMLAGERLKVVLVTIHKALREVPDLLTVEGIVHTAQVTHDSLKRYWGIAAPRLAVCGLNPHAGEGGLFGDEEGRIIAPAVKELKAQGIAAQGPLPPDTVFWRATRGHFDSVVCMYHDQGLIPLKLLHFEDGVNVSLGLPIIRTSVDHGTAYDLAGTGQANPASMIAAVKMAAEMAGAGE